MGESYLTHHFINRFKQPLAMLQTLEDMKVIEENIKLPKIVVLGDLSSGKTNIVGKLVGLSLPEGLKVALVIRFEHDCKISGKKMMLGYELKGDYVNTEVSEEDIEKKLVEASTMLLTEPDCSIDLVVKQPNELLSGLTIVDLPGIHADSEPSERKKQVDDMDGYISKLTGVEVTACMFLHVISVLTDFNSCVSRVVLKEFDGSGKQTVPVFTKLDLCNDKVITELTENNIINPMPSGYFFVNNVSTGKGDQTVKKSKAAKPNQFSNIDDKYFGLDVVAEHLVIGMLSILFGIDSVVYAAIVKDLDDSTNELERKVVKFSSIEEALPQILSIINFATVSLEKLFVGEVYREFRDDRYMHAVDMMTSKFNKFRSKLLKLRFVKNSLFLDYEYEVMIKENWMSRPKLSSSIMKTLLEKQFDDAKAVIEAFTKDVFAYVRDVVEKVLLNSSRDYQQLYGSLKTVAQTSIGTMKKSFEEKLKALIELEKSSLITCNSDFDHKLDQLKPFELNANIFKKDVENIKGLGPVKVSHLKNYPLEKLNIAFEMRMIMFTYWEILVNRFTDLVALNVMSLVKNMMPNGIKVSMREDFLKIGTDRTKLLETEPIVSFGKSKLEKRITHLKALKEDIEKLRQGFKYLL